MNHRGIEIIEYTDGRSGVKKYKARFQYKSQEYTPRKTSLEALKTEINRIFAESDAGLNPKIDNNLPFIDDILKAELKTVKNHKQKILCERVYKDFLALLPPLRYDELTQADFNAYCNYRRAQVNERAGAPVKNATINKELSAISVALANALQRFRALDGAAPIHIKKLPDDYKRRTRTVKEHEFEQLFAELYKPREKDERAYDHFYRVRLGHWLEFKSLTGLRRKEIALLKSEHYDGRQKALVNWRRPKTGTEVVIFPLRQRAAEIVEERISYQTEYLFSENGRPLESHYRKLKEVCRVLKIPYGHFTKGGFVMHDLRRNFGTEVVRSTDIETAREMLGHASLKHTSVYLVTDAQRMVEAVRKMDGIEIRDDFKRICEAVKSGEWPVDQAVKTLLELWRSR